jgi:hypothetical protein
MGTLKVVRPNYLERKRAADVTRLEEILRRNFGDSTVATISASIRRKESLLRYPKDIRRIRDRADRREALELIGLLS